MRMSLSLVVGSVVYLAILSATPARAVDPASGADVVAARAAQALYSDVRVETLPNGLRVYLKPVPTSPVVSLMVAYKVGSADEDLDHTGLSHYLEHLMFKGTDRIKPGDIDRFTLRNGGANNASTSEDATIYFFDFAADRWLHALDIEADRMRNLRIDAAHEFQQEKGAVIQELQRDEDEPWDLEQKAILPLLFGKSSPYGHPVIGQREHVRGATAQIIKSHYDKWYHPNNAALVVCGGFDPDQTLAHIKELFAPIPKATLPPRRVAPPVVRTAATHKDIVSRFDVPRMLMGFNTIRSGTPDFYALDVIDAVLSGGKTSRLYKELVDGTAIAGEIGTSNSAGRYPGWFSIQVQLLKGKNRTQAEQLVLAELKRLQDEPVSEHELRRVKRNLVASFIFSQDSVHNLAATLARGVTVNDLDFLKTYLPRIAAVTAKDIQEAARKYFDPDRRVVIWSIPPGQGTGGAGVESIAPPVRQRQRFRSDRLLRHSVPARFSFKNVKRVALPNGLTLLMFEDHRLPIFVAETYTKDVRLLEPANKPGLATLTGRLLDEGTDRHSGPKIAEMIEDVGGNLAFGASGGSVRTLSTDRHLGLALLFECLSRPAFPEAAYARKQAQLLSDIDDAQKDPEARASMLYKKLVYGAHPLGRPLLGTHESVAHLTSADCRAFQRRLFVPNNTILALVGDFDSNVVAAEIAELTRSWKQGTLDKPVLPAVARPTQFVQQIITLPDSSQLHFFMGHAGIRRSNPDYYKLLVMDYVLGTGPGFTDRLSSRLRDREGLAYTVTANMTSSATEEPGLFTCYIGTDPGNFDRVKQEFLQELERLRRQPPSRQEVEDAKRYLLGSLPFRFTKNGDIAQQLLAIERYQLGFNYLDDYRKAVAAVTPEEVCRVAEKYLDPKHMILVAAGALSKR